MAVRALSGGAKLEATLNRIATRVAKAAAVDVGFPKGADYPDGKPVAMVAALQEWGAPRTGIPPRPFFRPMIQENKDGWGPLTGAMLKRADYDGQRALDGVGAVVAEQLKKSIIDVVSPPLSPTTLMLRKMRAKNPDLQVNKTVVAEARARVAAGESAGGVSTKPLIDRGILLASVSHVVR